MSNYAIVSSGNPEADEKDLEKFESSEKRIRAGNCPNGCGGMVEIDAHNAECIRCGFVYFSSGGLKFDMGTPV